VQTYGDILNALGDPTRRRIFEILLHHGPRSVSAIASELPVSRPAVSQHLKILRASGLVRHEAHGTRHIYHPQPEGLEPLKRYVETLWSDVLGAFGSFAEQPERKGEKA
jgi:DNA-binding transcriptional ArsR family regulator